MSSKIPAGLSQFHWRTFELPRSAGSLVESLTDGEAWIGSWDGVGIYEGINNKLPNHQDTVVHLTTHRLIIINPPSAGGPSLHTSLSFIRQTEFYNGFMRSSAKITLHLGRPSPSNPNDSVTISPMMLDGASQSGNKSGWTCGVCGFVNPLSEFEVDGKVGAGAKCSLCGVGYTASRSQDSGTASRANTPVGPRASMRSAPRGLEGEGEMSGTQSGGLADPEGRIACPACTFLNHRYLAACEICSTPLPSSSTTKNITTVPTGNGTGHLGISGEEGKVEIVRLSFRKGGEKEAYKRLKNVLSDKVWERDGRRNRNSTSDGSASTSFGGIGAVTPRTGIGIDGVLQSISLDAKNQDDNMQDAFKDLEILMVRAGEMVRLAQSLNAKLTAQQNAAGPTSPKATEQEATLIRTSLVQLGLATPALTQDMVRDTKEYHEGLARELGTLLTGRKYGSSEGLMVGTGSRGVIGLDEVWGLWMRARGVALLSPLTLLAIIPYLPQHTSPPIRLLSLASKLKVLHTPHFSPDNFLNRLINLLTPNGAIPNSLTQEGDEGTESEPSLSLVEIAAHEGLAIGLAKEMVETVEMLSSGAGAGLSFVGGIVRDEQAGQELGGVRWYRDLISVWTLDCP